MILNISLVRHILTYIFAILTNPFWECIFRVVWCTNHTECSSKQDSGPLQHSHWWLKCIFGVTSLWASLGVTRYLMFSLHYFNLPLEHLPLPLSIVSLHGVKYIVLSCCHFSFGRNWEINNGRNWNTLSIHGIQKRGHFRGLYGTMRM